MMEYKKALAIASEFIGRIEDVSTRTAICDSIRREKSEIKDIDIVAQSKIEERATSQVTLGGEMERTTIVLLRERITRLLNEKVVSPREKSDNTVMIGKAVAFIMYKDVPLDLYYAGDESWWGLVQMRTGSLELNTCLAKRAIGMGYRYQGSGYGIVNKDGKRVDDGQSEDSIFKALKLKFIPPTARSIKDCSELKEWEL